MSGTKTAIEPFSSIPRVFRHGEMLEKGRKAEKQAGIGDFAPPEARNVSLEALLTDLSGCDTVTM